VLTNRQKPGLLQAELKVLLDQMPEAVFVFDAQGIVSEANAAAQRMFGQNRGDLSGLSLPALIGDTVVQQDNHDLLAPDFAVTRALKGESIHHEQRVYLRPGVEPLDALITAEPMRGAGNRIVGALVIIRDVTEIYNLQRRLEDTDRFLAIGQMAADIAHDLNNVLSTISQAAAVVDQLPDVPKSERRFYLDMVQGAVRRGAEIIQRMREYIRGGKGERLPVDVCETLREALELTHPLLLSRKNIQLQSDLHPVPLVQANAADLRRSFANVIFNAIEAMAQGGVLKVSCKLEEADVIVAVEDSGVGIAPEAHSHIFSPYYTTKAKGTGLGLSGARRIIRSHGGDISFESEAGQGAKFFIRLPLLRGEQKTAA
jgi:PAS domain S-box-containing protein